MRIVKPTTENDMIATFLGGEYTSARFGSQVHDALKKLKCNPRVITAPDLTNPEENTLRRRLLREARGYGSQESWFAGMPEDIQWYRATLDRDELANIHYIVYSYWIELTHKTLRAGDAVRTIHNNEEIFGVSNQPFRSLAQAIADGQTFPPMILVGTSVNDLVVLEGHSRLTGYLLAGERAPAALEVIVGLSTGLTNWKMYSYEAYDRHRAS